MVFGELSLKMKAKSTGASLSQHGAASQMGGIWSKTTTYYCRMDILVGVHSLIHWKEEQKGQQKN